MSWNVFLLVLFSAACHAGWNMGARKVKGHYPTIWLGLVVATILLTPLAFWSIRSIPLKELFSTRASSTS